MWSTGAHTVSVSVGYSQAQSVYGQHTVTAPAAYRHCTACMRAYKHVYTRVHAQAELHDALSPFGAPAAEPTVSSQGT